MQQMQTDRKVTAIEWWNSLSYDDQEYMCLADRTIESLTGHEIEAIWDLHHFLDQAEKESREDNYTRVNTFGSTKHPDRFIAGALWAKEHLEQ